MVLAALGGFAHGVTYLRRKMHSLNTLHYETGVLLVFPASNVYEGRLHFKTFMGNNYILSIKIVSGMVKITCKKSQASH